MQSLTPVTLNKEVVRRTYSNKTLAAITLALALLFSISAAASSAGRTLFITSAVERADGTVTLPLYRGSSHGQTVYYIILDTSDGDLSQSLGVNHSDKLANAGGTDAVQKVSVLDGVIDFPATVDFTPVRAVTAGPQGFPPNAAAPGAIGETGYSPLIQLPNGTVVNAPHIANSTGQADKVVSIDMVNSRVSYRETQGFQGGNLVRYVSTDASDPIAAALEGVTYAPALNNAPTLGDNSTDSARTSLAAFVNGQAGADNPERQGLNSALLDGLDPLNVLRWNPSQGRYSPLWDVHLAKWTAQAVASGQNLRQHDWGDVQNLADHGQITVPDRTVFTASGFIVNCPIVSSD